MSIVKSFSVGNGDMFYINHNSENFTIIDCCVGVTDRAKIVKELKRQRTDDDITRFISTHPDDDHLRGLVYLDDQLGILNFYCVQNAATKDDPSDDFERYCELRDSTTKAFHISAGCKRKWMNIKDETREHSGLHILWPKLENKHYNAALEDAENGLSPNNISAVIKYSVEQGPTVLWMGDLETDFMENIENDIKLPPVDILFAPHHGRDSGRIPKSMLKTMKPKLIVVGEAPPEHLHYYPDYDTITQNSAGDITFECLSNGWADIYVSSNTYEVDFLKDLGLPDDHDGYYLGSLAI
jgi:beta-lactamase superfamily II metal-dependent hydrolase